MTIYDITPSAKGRARDVFDTTSPEQKRVFDSYNVSFNARLPRGITLFGGFGLDRLLENSCDERDNPNLLRFCDEANLDAHLPDGEAAQGLQDSVPDQRQAVGHGAAAVRRAVERQLPEQRRLSQSIADHHQNGYRRTKHRRHVVAAQQHHNLPDGERGAVLPGVSERRGAMGGQPARLAGGPAGHRQLTEFDDSFEALRRGRGIHRPGQSVRYQGEPGPSR